MRVLLSVCVVLLFASCAENYNSPITGRLTAQQCAFYPLTDSVKALADAGLIHIEPPHSVGSNPQECDSVYRLQMTAYQKWKSNHHWFLYGAIFAGLLGFGTFGVRTSKGDNRQSQMAIIGITFLVIGLLMSGYYFYNPEREIRKADYIKYQGNLKDWWSLPSQSY